jgi:carnitine O-acetyltransferase
VDDKGEPLPLHILEERLYECIELAKESDDGPKLGLLTTSDRDSWSDARDELLRVGGDDMKRALEKLESGALMICLDDEVSTVFSLCNVHLFSLKGNIISFTAQ